MDTIITRREAHESITPKRPEIWRSVLDCLNTRELTAEEIADETKISLYNIRPRLTELKAEGKVETCGKKISPLSGKRTAIWRRK